MAEKWISTDESNSKNEHDDEYRAWIDEHGWSEYDSMPVLAVEDIINEPVGGVI